MYVCGRGGGGVNLNTEIVLKLKSLPRLVLYVIKRDPTVVRIKIAHNSSYDTSFRPFEVSTLQTRSIGETANARTLILTAMTRQVLANQNG